MEATRSSESYVSTYQTSRRHIPEDDIFQTKIISLAYLKNGRRIRGSHGGYIEKNDPFGSNAMYFGENTTFRKNTSFISFKLRLLPVSAGILLGLYF